MTSVSLSSTASNEKPLTDFAYMVGPLFCMTSQIVTITGEPGMWEAITLTLLRLFTTPISLRFRTTLIEMSSRGLYDEAVGWGRVRDWREPI